MKKKKSKICKIINSEFNYILEVDDQSIPIPVSSINYFTKHYKSLGYKIEKYKEKFIYTGDWFSPKELERIKIK